MLLNIETTQTNMELVSNKLGFSIHCGLGGEVLVPVTRSHHPRVCCILGTVGMKFDNFSPLVFISQA